MGQQVSFDSDWQLHKKQLQIQRDFNMITNRMNILARTKENHIKQIENKMEQHRRNIFIKLASEQSRRQMQQTSYDLNSTKQDSLIRNAMNRTATVLKIRKAKNDMYLKKVTQVKSIKNELAEIEKLKLKQKLQEDQQKSMRKHCVRLEQMQSKQKIYRYWTNKIEAVRDIKEQENRKKIQFMNDSIHKMSIMEMCEESTIKQLERTTEIKRTIDKQIKQQRSMKGAQLSAKYGTIIDHSKFKRIL